MALFIDETAIKNLRIYAEAHPFSFEDFKNTYNKKAKCAGDLKEHYIILPVHYKLVYSIDWCCSADRTMKFMCKHMSMSSMRESEEQRYPNEIALRTISKLLGFSPLESNNVIVQKKDKDPIPNIDIVEIIKMEVMTKEDKF